MLEKFGVLVLSEYLVANEKEIVIRAFSDFYHELTPKHQKRIQLHWVDGMKSQEDNTSQLFKIFDIPEKVIVRSSYKEKSNAMRVSSILLHPSHRHLKTVIPDSYSFGIPVIATDSGSTKDYIDVTCGLILKGNSSEQYVIEITNHLEMLYHDQEVLRLLEKGAYDQYEKKFGWGLKEFRKPLF